MYFNDEYNDPDIPGDILKHSRIDIEFTNR